MRYELVDGDAKLITIMVADGWQIVNTFPNPYPQPYFFALMSLDHHIESLYDVHAVHEEMHNPSFFKSEKIDRWNLPENEKARKKYNENDNLPY